MVATSARADDTHYQSILIGEEALGMGGAYTGVAEDVSDVFYNPAGLATLGRSAVSGSLSLNAFERLTIHDGLWGRGAEADLAYRGRPTLPLFGAAMIKVGRKDESGRRRHALAFSTLHPRDSSLRFGPEIFNADGVPLYDLRIERTDRVLYYGLSYAVRLPRRTFLGVSVFLSRRNLRHQEETSEVTGGTFNAATGSWMGAIVTARTSEQRIKATHIVFRLGVLHRFSRRFQLGCTLQPASIPLSVSGHMREDLVVGDGANATQTFALTNQKVDARSPIPWELRTGVQFRPQPATTLAMDLALYAPIRGMAVLSDPTEDPITHRTAEPGLFFSSSTRRRPVANVSVGVEHNFGEILIIRAGGFTNVSSSYALRSRATTFRDQQINLFGGSLSLGFQIGSQQISTGVSGMWGRGDAYGFDVETGEYVRRRAASRSIQVFVSGAAGAAARLARNTLR